MNNELCEGASGDAAVVRYPRITAKRNVNETTEIWERNWVTNPAPFFLVMSFGVICMTTPRDYLIYLYCQEIFSHELRLRHLDPPGKASF